MCDGPVTHTCPLRSCSWCYVSITHKKISRAASYFRFTAEDTFADTLLWKMFFCSFIIQSMRCSLFGCLERKLPFERAHALHLSPARALEINFTILKKENMFWMRISLNGTSLSVFFSSSSFLCFLSAPLLVYKSIINCTKSVISMISLRCLNNPIKQTSSRRQKSRSYLIV